MLFRREITTKMPELVDVEEEKEKVEVSDQSVRDRDCQKKQSNKDYVDKRFHAIDRNVRRCCVGEEERKQTAVFLRKVVAVRSDVLLWGPSCTESPQGVQYKR